MATPTQGRTPRRRRVAGGSGVQGRFGKGAGVHSVSSSASASSTGSSSGMSPSSTGACAPAGAAVAASVRAGDAAGSCFSLRASRVLASTQTTEVLSWRGWPASSTAFSRVPTQSLAVDDQAECWMTAPCPRVSSPSVASSTRSPGSSVSGVSDRSMSAISSPIIALMSMLEDRLGSGSTSAPISFIRLM